MAECTCCSTVAFERPNENTFTFTFILRMCVRTCALWVPQPPDPATVRPEPILRLAVDAVKAKWKAGCPYRHATSHPICGCPTTSPYLSKYHVTVPPGGSEA
jgi:hypothetical protein